MADGIIIGKADGAGRPRSALRQPARPDRRRHRHRQDGDPADAGRGLLGARRAGVPGRRQGRPLRPVHAGRAPPARSPSGRASSASTAGRRAAFPVVFWDVFGEQGHPIRATVSEMGPLLLARLLELNDTQEGVLNVAFAVADDEGLLLLDLKDLRAILQFVADNAKELQATYGNIAPTTVGAIQRKLLVLEREGGDGVLRRAGARPGRPDARRRRRPRRGQHPGRRQADQQAAALRHLPAVAAVRAVRGAAGGRATCRRPKLVLFFDEAHLLFDDAPKALVDKVEQVVRLIRSKGVGVYFVTQNPTDMPEDVLAQLGNRVQHALRAFTAKRPEGGQGGGRHLPRQSGLRHRGGDHRARASARRWSRCWRRRARPAIVQRTLIAPPALARRPGDWPPERQAVAAASPMAGRYDTAIDRQIAPTSSCARRAASTAAAAAADAPAPAPAGACRSAAPAAAAPPPQGIAEALRQQRRAQHRQQARPRDRPRRARLAVPRPLSDRSADAS